MEKIEGEKSKKSRKKKPMNLAALSAKMGRPEEDVLKIFNKSASGTATIIEDSEETLEAAAEPGGEYSEKLQALEYENARLKKTQDDARLKSDNLFKEIEEKNKAISELQKKLASESIGLIKDSDKEKSLINTALEKSISEYRAKLASLEAENRRQDSYENPGIDAEKQHLENRIKGDQACSIFTIALGKLIPDNHHCDAAR